jgi:hypothetical protein
MARGLGRGCLAVTIAGIGFAGLMAWLGWEFSHAFGPPDNHVAATDSRVCRSTGWNNVPFDQVMDHFRLKLPPGAQHVVFTANVNPLFGDYSLDLRFTTTPAALRSFLANAGLAPASRNARTTIDFGPSSCGLNPPASEYMAFTQDADSSPMAGSPRAVAVDLSNRSHPTVWVSAMDI